MKHLLILIVITLFTSSYTFAQADSSQYDYNNTYDYENNVQESSSYPSIDPAEISRKKRYDSDPIDVRRFDEAKWKEIVGGKNYTQEQQVKKRKRQEHDSTSNRSSDSKSIQRANRRNTDDVDDSEDDYEDDSSTGSTPINSPTLTIAVYAVAIGIIGYILFLVIKNTSLKSKGKIPKSHLPDHATHIEDIKELEIDRLLREAITAGNYRLVIRIYFLGLLQKLDEDHLIKWKKDKTNRDYLSELFSKTTHFEEVKRLTIAYEQVWYGDHNLPIQTYEQIISSFKTIDQKLKVQNNGEKG